jgi:hypothetical protein
MIQLISELNQTQKEICLVMHVQPNAEVLLEGGANNCFNEAKLNAVTT